jgi:FtsZ-binding cell division protein ZapB
MKEEATTAWNEALERDRAAFQERIKALERALEEVLLSTTR